MFDYDYADDLVLIDTTVDKMITRITAIANASEEQADMIVKSTWTRRCHNTSTNDK